MEGLVRVPVREQEPKVRATNFEEVCYGYNEEEAVAEASRCLNCKNAQCMKGCPVSINIPAGVGEGMQLSLSGKGNAARRGGVNGDLIVLIEEEEHPELVRDGNDLLYNVFIGYPEAVLGETVEIPTIEGKVKVKICLLYTSPSPRD